MKIGDRTIGPGQPPYIIAEIGVNHDGSIDRALELVDAAAHAGADAVKFQYFKTDLLLSHAAAPAEYQRRAGEQDPFSMLRRLELSAEGLRRAAARARERGLHAIVTVFSVPLVPVAAEIGFDAYKTASPDIINRPLLDALAATGSPLIVSTGASTMNEVHRAVEWLDGARNRLALLQCVSCYPTLAEDVELGGVGALHQATGFTVGYSDHTTGIDTGALAVRAGASILEKHLTRDREARGPDHAASLDADQLAEYVRLARDAAREPAAPADRVKRMLACEADVRLVARQSLVTTRAIRADQRLTASDIAIKRPGTGLEPWQLGQTIGRQTARAIEADVPIREEDLV